MTRSEAGTQRSSTFGPLNWFREEEDAVMCAG